MSAVAEYDGSSSVEEYTGDNLMYGAQIGLDYQRKNTEDSIILHYHKYDREYREAGTVDEYGSNAYTLRGERKTQLGDKISYGFGGEYKYDWGEFENKGSYSSSTKGHTDNKGLFSNIGFKPCEIACLITRFICPSSISVPECESSVHRIKFLESRPSSVIAFT